MKQLIIANVVLFTMIGLWGLFGDAAEVWSTLRAFDWYLVPLLVLLTVLSFGVRYVRWEFLLNDLAEHPGSWDRKESGAAYVAGLSGILTPLKAGELTRIHFARKRAGVPDTTSLSIILSERLIDGVAMILLAIFGIVVLLEAHDIDGWIVVAIVAGLAFITGIIFLLRQKSVNRFLVRMSQRIPGVNGTDATEDEFAEAMTSVMGVRQVAVSLALGVLSWSLQAMVFMVTLVSYGEPFSVATVAEALFIYPTAMLAGTISLLPLGLGTTDAAMVGLGRILMDLSTSELIAAALVARVFIIVPALLAGFGTSLRSSVKTA